MTFPGNAGYIPFGVIVSWDVYAEVCNSNTLTDDRDENTKVHNTRDSPSSRCETDDEADSDHSHKEQNEWRALLASV